MTGRAQQIWSQIIGWHAIPQAFRVENAWPLAPQTNWQVPICGAAGAAAGGAARDPLATAIMTTRNSVAIMDLFIELPPEECLQDR